MKSLTLVAIHVLAYGAVTLISGHHPSAPELVFAGLLIWMSTIDIVRFEIPDLAVALLVVTGVLDACAAAPSAWPDRVIGIAFWPAAFWTVAAGFRRLRGYDGLGLGDVKLVAGLAAWIGFLGMNTVVMAAAVAGAATLGAGLAARRGQSALTVQSAVAFGPFLCLSAWAVRMNGSMG
ncbi:prepilin peptidase [Defluviimonas salinarum]|uniref:A24 family peptidase n=1 Tax=Defluviimonas salinarum TaxID=2992147 RepID=A0ABT3J7X5_9RHOB|nr:A24 family peptidase [Defluviimonas salinarum]MCW3783535.1 A24 family peptidase [Defluviimonas salinarum]